MYNKNTQNWVVLIAAVLLITAQLTLTLPSTTGHTVYARQALQTATPNSSGAAWTGNFIVRPGLPFVWLRVSPQSEASVIATGYPNQLFVAATAPDGQTQVWDGMQYWGYVSVPAIS